jgi:hypothetical protein
MGRPLLADNALADPRINIFKPSHHCHRQQAYRVIDADLVEVCG